MAITFKKWIELYQKQLFAGKGSPIKLHKGYHPLQSNPLLGTEYYCFSLEFITEQFILLTLTILIIASQWQISMNKQLTNIIAKTILWGFNIALLPVGFHFTYAPLMSCILNINPKYKFEPCKIGEFSQVELDWFGNSLPIPHITKNCCSAR